MEIYLVGATAVAIGMMAWLLVGVAQAWNAPIDSSKWGL